MKTRSSTSRSSRRSSDSSGSQRIKRQRPRLQQQHNEKNYSSQDDRRQVVKGMEEEESSSSPKEDDIKRNKRLKNKGRIDECNKQNQNQNDEQKEELKEEEEEEVPWYRILFTRGDEEYDRYMRTEWGFEKRGDEQMFEKLSLEGQQAGLSWLTILRKRNAYRQTFHNFDINKVAAMTSNDVQQILDTTPSTSSNRNDIVIRHKGKIESIIHNARCIQQMRQKRKQEGEDDDKDDNDNNNNNDVFDKFIWSFIDDKPIIGKKRKNIATSNDKDNNRNNHENSTSLESYAMSKALKEQWGFKFVGPTTCYSMMQSIGMVIDHPDNSQEWKLAYERLKNRPGGYQYKD